LKAAAAVMDVEIIKAEVGEDGRLRGSAVQAAMDAAGDGVFAIVATGGTTNFGIVDRLDEIGAIANANNIWFHVDGAYGLAGILADVSKPLFAGLERADSFIVDPHKWLFAPFDACALIYRDPENGREAHTQHGEYLETLTESGDWNPSDYAYNLTRRPRGLPLWFSLCWQGRLPTRSNNAQASAWFANLSCLWWYSPRMAGPSTITTPGQTAYFKTESPLSCRVRTVANRTPVLQSLTQRQTSNF
jgi:glutamate/tyrosine decarboxylase-like PLP-dependent enzyme